jgi:hypothetical protein
LSATAVSIALSARSGLCPAATSSARICAASATQPLARPDSSSTNSWSLLPKFE